MAFNIKTTELGFMETLEKLSELIKAWEGQNQLLFSELTQLENEWRGTSGRSYKEGSGCIYANSIKRNTDLMVLRSEVSYAKDKIDFFDMAYAKSFINNIEKVGKQLKSEVTELAAANNGNG